MRFVQGSALDLPFPDATFDVVLNVEASNDYGDRPRFFREAARVLKPDGLLLYADTMKQGRRAGMEQELASAGFQADSGTLPAMSPRPAASTARAGARSSAATRRF